MTTPFINPGTPPIQPTQPTPESPKMGPGDVEQKPFSLPKKEEKGEEISQGSKQTPMDAAKDRPASPLWSEDERLKHLNLASQKLGESKTRLQGPESAKLTPDHHAALKRLTGLMNHDLRTIAQKSEGTFHPPVTQKGEGVVSFLTRWIDEAQTTMGQAMARAPDKDNVNPAELLKLQYAVQRASQRAEIFSSVIGSTVSGIKTLMSTQLG